MLASGSWQALQLLPSSCTVSLRQFCSLVLGPADQCPLLPAGGDYAQLTQANRGSAGFCYDIATLLPQYNPLAVPIPTYIDPQENSVSATAISTLLVFGEAFGEAHARAAWRMLLLQ